MKFFLIEAKLKWNKTEFSLKSQGKDEVHGFRTALYLSDSEVTGLLTMSFKSQDKELVFMLSFSQMAPEKTNL